MHREENFNVMPSGIYKPRKKKVSFIFIGLLLITGFLSFKIIPAGLIILIIFPLVSLGGYFINFPLKSSNNLHSFLFLLTFITAIIVGINWKNQVTFLSRPFVEGGYQDKQVVVDNNGSLSWEDVNKFVPKNKKEENIMDVIKLLFIGLVLGSTLLCYFVDKWYNSSNPQKE